MKIIKQMKRIKERIDANNLLLDFPAHSTDTIETITVSHAPTGIVGPTRTLSAWAWS